MFDQMYKLLQERYGYRQDLNFLKEAINAGNPIPASIVLEGRQLTLSVDYLSALHTHICRRIDTVENMIHDEIMNYKESEEME